MPAAELPEPRPAASEVLDSPEAGGKVVRGSTMRVAAYVGGLLVGLASTPLIVRHLGVVDYGRYATVASLIYIVAALTEGGIAALGLREYATLDADGRRGLIRNLLGLRLALVLVAAAMAVGFAAVAGYTDTMVAGTVIMSGGLFLMAYQDVMSIPLKTELRLGWVSVIDFVRQIAIAVGMIALVIAGASLLPFYVAAPVSALIGIAITLRVLGREVPRLPGYSPAAWWALFRQTFLYASATALGILYFQLALVITSLVTTPRETGLFGVSFRIVELVNGIPWLVTTTAFPLIARAATTDVARLRYALQRMFDVSLVAGTWVALAMVIGAPFAIEVIGGSKFEDAIPVLRILGLIPVATFMIAAWAYALLALQAYRRMLAASGLAIVVIGVLTPILADADGARGAAVAAAITEFTLAGAYAVALMGGRPDLRVSLGRVPRVVAAAAVAVAPVLLFTPPSVVGVALATVLYAAAIWFLRAVPEDVIESLFARVRRS